MAYVIKINFQCLLEFLNDKIILSAKAALMYATA